MPNRKTWKIKEILFSNRALLSKLERKLSFMIQCKLLIN